MSEWETKIAIDFDSWAAKTYAANFPSVDVRCAEVGSVSLPGADVIVGGPPCQPFSAAGENEGESDARDCIPDFIRSVRKVRPRMFLMENVRGLLKARHMPYFGRVLKEFDDLAYEVQYQVEDAVDFGVPQFRARVWVWGIRRDVYAKGARHIWPMRTHQWPPEVEGMFGRIGRLPGVTVGQALGLHGAIRKHRAKSVVRRDHPTIDTSAALGGGGGHSFVEYDHGCAVAEEPSPTLKAAGNVDCNGHQGGGCPPVVAYHWSEKMLSKHPPASPAPTVQAKYAKGGAEGLLEMVDNPKHQPHQPHQPANTLRSGGDGHGMPDDCRSLAIDRPCETITGCSREPIQNWKAKLYVRRLTPLECLRLQSGPDTFKWPEKITKTAMYRIVGNGWASRMGAVFAAALKAADPQSRTVIDLFCGGGLGAVGWHGNYWSYENTKGAGV